MEINLIEPARPGRRPARPHRLRLVSGPLRALAQRYVRNLVIGTEIRLVRGEGARPAIEANALCREAVRRFIPAQPGEVRTFPQEVMALIRDGGGLRRVTVKGSPLARDIRVVMRAAGLGAVDGAVLQFLATIHLARGLEPFTDLLVPLTLGGAVDVVAVATGFPRRQVAASLDGAGRLVGSGLVSLGLPPGTVDQKFAVDLRLRELLSEPGLTVDRLRQAFVPRAPPPTLDLGDFDHLAAPAERAARLLEAAVRGRERGINLLLHGPTGAGKTELARVLAARAGLTLHVVGTSTTGGFTPSPPERLGALLLGQRLLGRARAALLFDELEDLFEVAMARSGGRAPTRMSKAWFNDLLERNAVPAIWIINDPSVLDPAFLRRFSMSVALEPLDAPRRRRVLERAGVAGAELPAEVGASLATRFPVSAAELTNAVRVARLVGGGTVEAGVVEGLLDSSVRLVTGAPPPPPPARTRAYRAGLVNASLDLEALAERLASPEAEAGVTLCLHGPPGTGKSEYVRHLAERLGRPLVLRRVSDIESKYVGEAEKNLAEAFEAAARERAILLFDEADSFLRERARATQRWEVTLTNEFLQRLEEAGGIVACTTNLFEDLDKAVLRRFTLRIGFDYLRPEQAEGLFQATLAPLLPPDAPAAPRPGALERCGPLAPGDFAVVARRARLLGGSTTVDWLLGELAGEASARGLARRPAVGFQVGEPAKVVEEQVVRG